MALSRDDIQIGQHYRVLVDRPRGAVLYKGDVVRCVRKVGSLVVQVVMVSGRGENPGYKDDWNVGPSHLEPADSTVEPPDSVDVFSLLRLSAVKMPPKGTRLRVLRDNSASAPVRTGDIVEMVEPYPYGEDNIRINFVSGRGHGSSHRHSKGYDWYVDLADVELVDVPPEPAPAEATALNVFDVLRQLQQ